MTMWPMKNFTASTNEENVGRDEEVVDVVGLVPQLNENN